MCWTQCLLPGTIAVLCSDVTCPLPQPYKETTIIIFSNRKHFAVMYTLYELHALSPPLAGRYALIYTDSVGGTAVVYQSLLYVAITG